MKRLAADIIAPPNTKGRLQKKTRGRGKTKNNTPRSMTRIPPTKSCGLIA